jgi:predicted transcriptional regulator
MQLMTDQELSDCLVALANTHRRQILQVLAVNHPHGTALKFLCGVLGKPAYSISRHVDELEQVSLLTKEKVLPYVSIKINQSKLDEVLDEILKMKGKKDV